MLTAGFVDVLQKPVEPSLLVEIVGQYVGREPLRSSHSGRTVLLADDDPTQRKHALLALTSAGFDVVIAEDGEAAFRLAKERTPDAIVSDVLMPKMDGFALCRAARSDASLAGVPIVLMSAHYVEDADRALGARFGATRYVSRSGGFDVVVRALLDAMVSPTVKPAIDSAEDLQTQYMRQVTHQLERQAAMGAGLARRVALQASALSVLDGLSDSLARQLEPETALDETLAECLDAAGLSAGAILLLDAERELRLKAHVGSKADLAWSAHRDILDEAIRQGGLMIPSAAAGRAGEKLLAALGAASALVLPIVARDDPLGTLLLASNAADLAGAEGDAFVRAARAISRQLGQALALSRLFARLTAAEQRYRVLLENAQDGIAISTPDGVFLEVNRRAEEMMGRPREQLLGRRITEFAPRSNVALVDEVVERGGGTIAPVPLTRPDGSVVQVEFSSTVVDIGGEKSVLHIGRDVSERLRLEDQLRQSQKMEAIGRLAGGIAHDFNNVLSVILCYGETMLGDLKPGDPMRADVEEIRKAAKRAAELTRQLLMFSRQQVVEPKVLDLNDLLIGLDKMLQRILGADVDLVSLPATPLGRVRVDPGSMEQVIMNLVVNARDAMPTGGKLTLETANVFLDETYARQHHGAEPGPHVMLAVTDTGVGMDKATLARAFEPFFTTKATGKGTGLGLSTVFGIVHQSKGHIWIYSELGQGTTLKIYLPRVDAKVDSVRPSQDAKRLRGSETILLVDDDDALRGVVEEILRKSGYRVISAANAGEALLASEQCAGTIHLLLTDVVMPQMSGPELAKRLGSLRPDMKLLCMSGYTDDSIVRHGVLESQIAYVQKPLMPETLLAKVRDVLENGK
jgi:PAS domain S-box-containing protein